jgi:hypothetical protein
MKINPMNKNQSNIAVAIYGTNTEAESAISELQQSSFDMKKLSIVGRGSHIDRRIVAHYNTENCTKRWGKIGGFWGEIWGVRLGPVFFFIPGFGSLVFAGPIVGWFTGALQGAEIMGCPNALGAGLISMGIPEHNVSRCEASQETDKFVIIAHGTAEEVKIAHDIIVTTSPDSIIEHQTANDSEYFAA